METLTKTLPSANGVDQGFECACMPAQDALADAVLVEDWRRLVDASDNPHLLFVSPDWIGHITKRTGESTLIWTIRDAAEALVGVVPISRREFHLKYDVANRDLCRLTFNLANVIGSQPCVPENRAIILQLIEGTLEVWPDCDGLCFESLPTNSFCSEALHNDSECHKLAHVYSPFGHRPWHLIRLAESFDKYLQTKSAKSRSTLRRKVRLLEQSGDVRLERYSQADHVPDFIDGVSTVSHKTWQHRLLGQKYRKDDAAQREFRDLANRGLLRSYLLWCDCRPCAYVVGYQYHDVYYYADVGFDPDFSERSPGTVSLFLMLKDLHEFDRPRVLDFGIGDASYKRRFGTDVHDDETILVLRAGLRNRFSINSHRAFMAVLNNAKKLMGRRVRK